MNDEIQFTNLFLVFIVYYLYVKIFSANPQAVSSILCRVAVWDSENKQVIELITNQRTWTANTIDEWYKARWQIEISFQEINQLLHVKSFVGTSHNEAEGIISLRVQKMSISWESLRSERR